MSDKPDLEHAADLALKFAASRGRDQGRANFFEAIAVFLTETLGVTYAFVAELDDTDEPTVTTLGLAEKNTILPNVSYPLAGSPCANVITSGVCKHASGIQAKYPDDPMLVEMGGQSYVGVVLPSVDGKPVGHLAVIDQDEMDDTEGVAKVLSILSTCAAWEIERQNFETQITLSESRFRDFAKASSDWFWEMDPHFCVTYISQSVEDETGIPASNHIGKTRWELAGADITSEKWKSHIAKLERREPFRSFEYDKADHNGVLQTMTTSGVPFFDNDGNFAGYRGTASNITADKTLQNKLSASDEQYQRAMKHAAIWEWDVKEKRLFASARLNEMLGYDDPEFEDLLNNSIKSLVHPDDLNKYMERLNTVLDYPDTVYESEHRLRQKSGEYRWFETRGRATCNDQGEPVLLSGLIIDTTDRKEMEQSLSEATERAIRAERRLTGAVNSLEDAFAIYDSNDQLVMCNDTYRSTYAKSADLMKIGTPFEDIIRGGVERGQYAEAIGREEEWIKERLEAHQNAAMPIEHKLNDGRWIRVSEHMTPDGDIVGVRVDVTLFKQAQELAESANKAKSEFLSSMSHELRTPLNAILGFGQLLRNDGKNPLSDAQQRAVKHILNSGSHLLTLIDEVLDLAKIEAGQERMSIEHTDIADVVESSLSLVQTLADESDIKIEDKLNPDHMMVMADYTRLKQVLVNLLSNAVKYNSENGSVVMTSEAVGNKVRVNVTDTGPGIPQDRFEELFKPFERLGAETTEIEGTGIGLTICRRLVELMSGTIGVESTEGEGSTFWIELPASTSPDLAEKLENSMTTEPTSSGHASSNTDHGPFSILYVEDNPTNIRLMEQIIDLVSNAELNSTYTAENALELIAENKPDLILMDINLPGMNGIQALNRLKASPDTNTIPVIAISADAIPESIQRGLEAGFHAYLTKPIRVDEILDIIDSLRGS